MPEVSDIEHLSDQEIFAKTIWGESRSEGELGMQAVACVIINRKNHGGWWGNSIRSVCTKPYQFSCWLESDPNRHKLLSVAAGDPQYDYALYLAANTGDLVDVTAGADSYQVIGTNAKWSKGLTPCAVIGKHEFFRTV